MSDASGVTIREVTHKFSPVSGVAGVTCEIRPGELLGLVGRNGSGKSTLMRCIAGLLRCQRGHVWFHGRELHRYCNPARVAGFALSPNAMPRALTAEDVMQQAALLANSTNEELKRTIDGLGITPFLSRRISSLSTGMRQRVHLGQALVSRPGSLVLDEPLNGLDLDASMWLHDEIRSHCDRGGTAIISSHLLDELEAIADTFLILDQSRPMYFGKLEGIARESSASSRVEVDNIPAFTHHLEAHSASYSRQEKYFVINATPAEVFDMCVTAGVKATALGSVSAPSLRESYAHLLGKSSTIGSGPYQSSSDRE